MVTSCVYLWINKRQPSAKIRIVGKEIEAVFRAACFGMLALRYAGACEIRNPNIGAVEGDPIRIQTDGKGTEIGAVGGP
jgi:hypothetical protein